MRSDVADATRDVTYDIVDTNMWGGGGGGWALGNFFFGGIRPPAQDTYLQVFCTLRISSLISLVSVFKQSSPISGHHEKSCKKRTLPLKALPLAHMFSHASLWSP